MNKRLISRRAMMAVSAVAPAVILEPAMAQNSSSEVDIAIIGAGAAGIAAATRLRDTGRSIVVLEARDRVGGRCTTQTGLFSTPIDLGAHWLHNAPKNPLVPLLQAKNLELYFDSDRERLLVNGREAREGEIEEYIAAKVAATRAVEGFVRTAKDVPLAELLPDARSWNPTIQHLFGADDCGKETTDISTLDFVTVEEGPNMFCRQGFGTGLAALSEGLPIRLNVELRKIDTSQRLIALETSKGTIRARAVILTVPVANLLAGGIAFTPALPKRIQEAASRLSLGAYEHIILEIPGNPAALPADERIIAKADSQRTVSMLARIGGSDLWYLDAGGAFARDLWKQGEAAIHSFAREWTRKQFGLRLEKAITTIHATNWQSDPMSRGAWSVAAPGFQGERRILGLPIQERLFLAGEALDMLAWGTVGGAWNSGTRAADTALRQVGGTARKRP